MRSVVISEIRSLTSRGKGYQKFKDDCIDNTFSLPEIEQLANQEWKAHIGKLAWENIKSGLSGKVIEAFLLFSEGFSAQEIAVRLNVEANTVNVYKKRVREKLLREINLLDSELS